MVLLSLLPAALPVLGERHPWSVVCAFCRVHPPPLMERAGVDAGPGDVVFRGGGLRLALFALGDLAGSRAALAQLPQDATARPSSRGLSVTLATAPMPW